MGFTDGYMGLEVRDCKNEDEFNGLMEHLDADGQAVAQLFVATIAGHRAEQKRWTEIERLYRVQLRALYTLAERNRSAPRTGRPVTEIVSRVRVAELTAAETDARAGFSAAQSAKWIAQENLTVILAKARSNAASAQLALLLDA